jgi:dTDP-glucose 4,6-dehydratase
LELGATLKILVTGGAGFIGSFFVKRQLDKNPLGISEIIVLDKLTYAGNMENYSKNERELFRFVEADICDTNATDLIIETADYVVNFAAESHVDRSLVDASAFLNSNTLGTQVLLENCRRHGIEKFVQISTDEVYGSIAEGSWDENFPLMPNSPYSASKASADLIVHAYQKTFGVNTNVTRCSNNYGPYQYPEKIIPLFVTNLIQKKKLPMYGTGSNIREWIHVEDHCRGIELVISDGKSGEIYNIGSGNEMTNLELARLILKEMDEDESLIDFVNDRQGHDFRYSVSSERISRELGFVPQIDFLTGLRSTIEFYKNERSWWEPLK